MHILHDHQLQINLLADLGQRPPLFEGATVDFWRDPHIAQQMLTFHLNPDVEAASRRPADIARIVHWLYDRLSLAPGSALLDLGCGPGLYCWRLAEKGLRVTGVDFSENSIRYAREHDPHTTYIYQDYLTLDAANQFDAVTLIYGDYCVLNDSQRARLLGIVRRALKPGGWFAFDVSTEVHHAAQGEQATWEAAPAGGFWRPGPHLVLTQTFLYSDADTALDQYAVIEPSGLCTVYRNWFRYFSPATITAELEAGGFTVDGLYSDLTGTPLTADSVWLGVIARRD